MDSERMAIDEEMIVAVRRGELREVAALRSRGASFAENLWGESAMNMAAKRGDAAMIQLLGAMGASAKEPTRLGRTPAMAACGASEGSGVEALRALAKLGADFDARESSASPPGSARAPGDYGEEGGDEEPPHMGLLTGAGPASRRDGDSALHFACVSDAGEELSDLLAAELLALGASPSLANRHGVTPLMLAAAMDRPGLVSMLIEAGAPLEDRDSKGCSALMRALQAYAVDPALALLRAGADPRSASAGGSTCADWAAEMEHPEVSAALASALALAESKEIGREVTAPGGACSSAGRPRV